MAVHDVVICTITILYRTIRAPQGGKNEARQIDWIRAIASPPTDLMTDIRCNFFTFCSVFVERFWSINL